MATEVERLRKEIANLESRKSEHLRKHTAAVERKIELETRRQALLAQIAEGNEGARRDLRHLDGEIQDVHENEQAFSVAGTSVARQLETANDALTRAEREAAIDTLETQMASLSGLNNEVEDALALVKQKSDALFSAAKEVAAQLSTMDEKRFDSAFGYKLTALLKEAIHHRFEEMGFPNAEKRPSFLERATPQLRAAIAQLRYQSQQGRIVPGKKEKLYRALWRVRGIRNLDLRPGSLIALREDEAAPLLEGGSLELAEGQASTNVEAA
jgi:hypothetical protein